MQNKSITSCAAALFALITIAAFNVHADDKDRESISHAEHEMSHEEALHEEHGMPSPVTTRSEIKKEAFYNAHELTQDESLANYKCPPFPNKKSCLAEVQKKQSACLEGVKSMGIHIGTVEECLKRAENRKVSCAKNCH